MLLLDGRGRDTGDVQLGLQVHSSPRGQRVTQMSPRVTAAGNARGLRQPRCTTVCNWARRQGAGIASPASACWIPQESRSFAERGAMGDDAEALVAAIDVSPAQSRAYRRHRLCAGVAPGAAAFRPSARVR